MEIIFVFGKICSGKDYICNTLNTFESGPKYKIITISNILRKITGFSNRSDLFMTEDLKDNIFEELSKEFDSNKIIINGIRQIEVLDFILENYENSNIKMYWIECDDDLRKKRFENRNDRKDNLTIEEDDARDNKMGLSKILEKYGEYMTLIDNNF